MNRRSVFQVERNVHHVAHLWLSYIVRHNEIAGAEDLSLSDVESDGFVRSEHDGFILWLNRYIQTHPKSIIVSEEKYKEIKGFLEIQASKKKGSKNQFGSAQFRHWIRRQGFELRKHPKKAMGDTDEYQVSQETT